MQKMTGTQAPGDVIVAEIPVFGEEKRRFCRQTGSREVSLSSDKNQALARSLP
jgi:hypothetical protein